MKTKRTICLILAAFMLILCGCSAFQDIPQPPQVTPYIAPVETPDTDLIETPEEASPIPGYNWLVQFCRNSREAMDPENGTEKILDFWWDSVRVESPTAREAAVKMTETLGTMEDVWYTGSGENAFDSYGYDAMLVEAEDMYGLRKEYGGDPAELSSTRELTCFRADDEIVVFLVNHYIYLGGAHGDYKTEGICFDAKTGERLHLEDLSSDGAAFRTRVLEEMLRLVDEDADGYYSERLMLPEGESREDAFGALLRDGAWYPAEDGLLLFSDTYELASYAAGIVEFLIPYERLSDCLDARWLPTAPTGTANFSVLPLTDQAEGGVEIVDRLIIGNDDSGESCLLVCEGSATDLSIDSVYFVDRFYSGRQMWYCGSFRNAALQMVILFPGDLPNCMLRYRDAQGEHELLIGQSGYDGSILLTENDFSVQG